MVVTTSTEHLLRLLPLAYYIQYITSKICYFFYFVLFFMYITILKTIISDKLISSIGHALLLLFVVHCSGS